MSEQAPPAGELPGPYNSPRDAVLHYMTTEGWATASSGDTGSPTGWFARISNQAEELDLLTETFIEQLLEHGAQPEDLVGHYLVVQDDRGFVAVAQYASEAGLKLVYSCLEDQFNNWATEDGVGEPI